MSKTKSPKPAGRAPATVAPGQAQGSLFPEAAPSLAAAPSPPRTRAAEPRRPAGPTVRGRRRPQPKGLAALYGRLLAEGDYAEEAVTLRPAMVGTHPAHPDRIVGDGDEAIRTLRYAIVANADGSHLGNVLVHGESRFTLVAPLIQEKVTIHLNLAAVAMRADVAAQNYLVRSAAADGAPKRRA